MINAQQTAQRQAEIDALNEDEFDPEAQARIAERIQQENIQANMEAAFEHSPEAFGQVSMLYVRLEASFAFEYFQDFVSHSNELVNHILSKS